MKNVIRKGILLIREERYFTVFLIFLLCLSFLVPQFIILCGRAPVAATGSGFTLQVLAASGWQLRAFRFNPSRG
jgi:hypothetical protein